MLEYFDAEEGAYTAFTDVEIQKGTFNVKSVIRNLLIRHLGHDNIPRAGLSNDQNIEFKVCGKSKIYNSDTLKIPCKFSKPDKEEMTIYFNREQMSPFHEGDYWYVYFRESDNVPVIGILSDTKWNNLFGYDETDEMREPDETGNMEISYTASAAEMDILEEIPPEASTVIRTDITKTRKSMSADEAAVKAHNRKAKGNMGEELVIEIEKRRLEAMDREDLIPKIAYVAKYKDGLGYDIISMDVDAEGNEQEIYIEVKTTAGDKNMPFYVSHNEISVSRKYGELYYIYRIYNLASNSKRVNYYRLKGAIDKCCKLTPVDYIAIPKRQIDEE
jgi:hypothetical protein